MAGISVDPVASLDELKERGYEPSVEARIYEDPPDLESKVSCVDLMRLLQEINRAKPRALNVLLDSGIDRMTMPQIAKHLRIKTHTVHNLRTWMNKNHPALARCLNSTSLRPNKGT
jgi:DNA-directed RNA polymerase specialized sigma24 family protein